MRVSDLITCPNLRCADVRTDLLLVPRGDVDPDTIKIVMISEAPPPDPRDDFYAPGDPSYLRTTIQAFRDAGVEVGGIAGIIALGVYITTAVKCAKRAYALKPETVETCSQILEREIALFPNVGAYLLMGDTAVRAMNDISKRRRGHRIIPSGSTYKIRSRQFSEGGERYFPSYLQTGGSYLIEKSKRRMIAEDLREALRITRDTQHINKNGEPWR